MDVELLVVINIMTISALAVAIFASRRDLTFAWSIALHLAILAAGALAILWQWPHPALIVGIPFTIFVAVPALLLLRSQRRAAAGDSQGALKFMRWATVFQPTPAMRFQARVMEAQNIESPDARADAFRSIAKTAPPRAARLAEVYAWHALDRWDEILKATADASAATPELAVMQLRALGECGRVSEMVAAYANLRAKLPEAERRTAELFVLAFAGRETALKALLGRRHAPYDAETKAYWKAIAALSAGKGAVAVLHDLAATASRSTTRLAAARHLERTAVQPPQTLPPEAIQTLDTLAARIMHEADISALPRRHAYATLILLAAIFAMFTAELFQGDPEDLATLFTLGGLWPASVLSDDEWWRLGSALFLHFGWAHLAVNALSLYVLGRAVEARYGTFGMLLTYASGGLLSSAAVLYLMKEGIIAEGLLVGASGAIMALFGAIIAAQVANWRRSRDVLDRRPLMAFLGLVILQTIIDLTLPQVSLAAHLAGLIAGFIIALPLATLRAASRRTAA